MALTDLTRISTSGIATGSTIDSPILRKDVSLRGSQVGVTSVLFDSSDDKLNLKNNVKLAFGIGTTSVNLFYKPDTRDFRHEFDGDGNYVLLTNNFDLKNEDGSKAAITANNPGGVPEVRLHHDGNERIRTTNEGAVVTGILTATSFSGPILGSPINNPSGISTFYDVRVSNNLTVEGTTTTLDTNLIGVDRVEVGANSNTLAGIAVTQSGSADLVRLYDGSSQVVTVDDTGNVGLATDTGNGLINTRHAGTNQQVLHVKADLGSSNNRSLNLFTPDTDNTNAPFRFQTGNGYLFQCDTENVLTIAHDRKVGIGTDNPTENLDIIAATTSQKMRIWSKGSSNNSVLNLRAGDSGGAFIHFGDNSDDDIGQIHYSNSQEAMRFVVNTQERLRITSAGRVGIGTTNTVGATGLTVYRNDTALGNTVLIEQDGTGDAVLGFALKGTAAWQFGIDNSDSDKFKISYDGSGLDSSTSVTLDRNGKVGIGTDNPLAGLVINSYGTQPVPNGNTYPYPAGNWSNVWNYTTANNTDYWVGFAGGYNVSSATVNISLAPNTFNFSTQQGIYIAGEATSTSSADFTVGRIIGGSVAGVSASAGNQRATKDELFRIKSDGKVGVNESSPDHMFHIKGTSADNNPILAVESDSWVSGRSAALRLAYTAGNAREIRGHYENGLQFILNNGEAMRIATDGKVGIGTENPSKTLTLYGASSSSFRISKSGVLAYDHTFDGSTYTIANNNGSAGIPIVIGTKTAGGESLRIDSSGRIGIGTNNPTATLDVRDASGSDPTFFIGHSDADVIGEAIRIGRVAPYHTIRYHSIKAEHSGGASSNMLAFHLHKGGSGATDQVEVMRLRGDGNVGINSAVPTSALEVRGEIFARGATTSDKPRIKFGFTNGVIQGGKTEGNVGSDYLAISGNGGGRDDLVVNYAGNIGINESAPSYKLQVNGSVYVDNSSLNVQKYTMEGTGNWRATNHHISKFQTSFTNGGWFDVFKFTKSSNLQNNNYIGVYGGVVHIVYINERSNSVQTSGYCQFPFVIRGRSNSDVSGTRGSAIAHVSDVIGSAVDVRFNTVDSVRIDMQVYIYNSDGASGENQAHIWIDSGGVATANNRAFTPAVI